MVYRNVGYDGTYNTPETKPEADYSNVKYRNIRETGSRWENRFLKFDYKLRDQWLWRTMKIKLSAQHYTNDELEKFVIDWCDLRARSGRV